jgi:CheY-like chemotaxis protein
MQKLRILLADDHETVREGLKAILNAQSDMEVIGEATDGEAAVAQATQLNPDVVVLATTAASISFGSHCSTAGSKTCSATGERRNDGWRGDRGFEPAVILTTGSLLVEGASADRLPDAGVACAAGTEMFHSDYRSRSNPIAPWNTTTAGRTAGR